MCWCFIHYWIEKCTVKQWNTYRDVLDFKPTHYAQLGRKSATNGSLQTLQAWMAHGNRNDKFMIISFHSAFVWLLADKDERHSVAFSFVVHYPLSEYMITRALSNGCKLWTCNTSHNFSPPKISKTASLRDSCQIDLITFSDNFSLRFLEL